MRVKGVIVSLASVTEWEMHITTQPPPVSEMTYAVSSGTLNSAITYHHATKVFGQCRGHGQMCKNYPLSNLITVQDLISFSYCVPRCRISQKLWRCWGSASLNSDVADPLDTPPLPCYRTKFGRSPVKRFEKIVAKRLQKILILRVPPFWVSLNVIGIATDRSAICYFLLVVHSNHGPILCRYRGKRQFMSKNCKFFQPFVFNSPAKELPVEFFVTVVALKNTRAMPLPDGEKSLTICAFV